MKNETRNRFITENRLKNYNSFDEYKNNLYESEEYYILLSIFEISLRNSIDIYFRQKIGENWLESDILHFDTKKRIDESKSKILYRKEVLSHDKIIAELPFGFWTSLFRKSYSNLIRIKDITNILPNIPNRSVKLINRNILDRKFNEIRKFRNRIFHYERIINKPEFKDMKENIHQLLLYFDKDIYDFALELTDK